MPERLKKLLFVLLVVVLVIAGFLLFNNYSPLPYYIAHPTNYTECVSANGTLFEDKGIKSCIFRKDFFLDHKGAKANELNTYTDDSSGYTLKYPGDIFKETDTNPSILFLNNKSYGSTTLVHMVNIKHCDLSGNPEGCTPQTTDISITLTPINKKYTDVIAAATKQYTQLDDWQVGTLKGKTYTEGAEGEGRYYYFIELNNNKTLLVTRTYINEDVVSSYKESKDFIKYTEQEKLLNQLFETFKLIPNK